MLVKAFPTLPLALIHKTIAFYLENQADIDAHMAGRRVEIKRQIPRTQSNTASDLMAAAGGCGVGALSVVLILCALIGAMISSCESCMKDPLHGFNGFSTP